MNEKDITILGFSEAGRAALSRIQNLTALIEAYRERVQDYEDDHRAVVEGQCAGDERHCSCVPHLRRALAAEKARAEKAETELNQLGWQYEALKTRYRLAMRVVDLARPLRGYLDLQCAVAAVDAVPGDEGKR